MAGFVLAVCSALFVFTCCPAVPATGQGLAAWRILQRFMRYGLRAQSASLVRGSSRRITIVRFRPADIRVINRRICLLSCHRLCWHQAWLHSRRKPKPGFT